ncbi:MAG: hypothetical protein R3F20_12750 [Planctomycetota bacterium]
MEEDEALALLLVGHRDDREDALGDLERRLHRLLDAPVGDHLAAHLREAREAIADLEQTFLVDPSDVAGHVAARAEGLGGPDRIAEIAAHQVRSGDEDQALLAVGPGRAGLRVDDGDADAGQGPADARLAVSGLEDAAAAEVGRGEGDHR